jgi:membrane protein DedA with SNARE-associated domain
LIVLASVSTNITDWIAQNGVYAVFALMAIDALLPAGGELIMLYAGALASGSVSGHRVSLFGVNLSNGVESYIVLALAGTLGYLLGSMIGWAIGHSGGRALVERHGRWLHLSPETFARAEQWFDRHGPRAVLFGRITPVVRSFISIPAGVFRSPIPSYVPLTLLGSAIWCFSFAAVGWALGGSWETFHENFSYADYVVAAAVVFLIAFFVVRHFRARRSADSQAVLVEEPSD